MTCPRCSDASYEPGKTPVCQKCGFSDAPPEVTALLDRAIEARERNDPRAAIGILDQALKKHPNCVDALMDRAGDYFRLSDYDHAFADIDRALALAPFMAQLYCNRGLLHVKTGETEKALADYNHAIELDPGCVKAYVNRADLIGVQDPDQALHDLGTVIGMGFREPGVFVLRGSLLARRGLFAPALRDINEALRLAPKAERTKQLRDDVVDAAKRAFEQALAETPCDPSIYMARSEVWRALGETDNALADLNRAVELAPRDAELLADRALLYFQLDKPEQARTDAEMAIKLNPNLASAYRAHSLVSMAQGRTDEAIQHVSEAMRLAPDYARDYFVRAQLYLSREPLRLFEALADLNRAIELGEQHPAVFENRARTLLMLGKAQEAIPDMRRAAELDPSPDRCYSYGLWLSEQNMCADALPFLNWAIKLNPKHAAALCERGLVNKLLDREDLAMRDYDAALEVDTSYAIAWTNRGIVYLGRKDWPKALEHANQAIKLAPDFAWGYKLRAFALEGMHKYAEAIADLNKILTLQIAEQEREQVGQRIAQLEQQLKRERHDILGLFRR